MNNQTRVDLPENLIKQHPYKCIGKLTVTFQSGQSVKGTATLVAPNLVVTSAKLLYHERFGVDSIKIEFGVKDKIVVNKNLKVFYSDALRQGYNKIYDFGFIQMKDDLSEKLGYIPLNFFQSLGEDKEIQIVGYPLNYNGVQVKQNTKLVSAKGVATVKRHESGVKFLQHEIETSVGQEGSPILAKVDDQYTIIGIHISNGDNIEQRKLGLYLNYHQRIQHQFWFAEKQADFNYFSNMDLSKFASFCRQRVSTLEEFKLRDAISMNKMKNQLMDELVTLENLRQLDLAQNKLETFNIQELTPKICNLDLSKNLLSNQFFISLNSKKWQNLTFLYLENNQIYRAKMTPENFPRLKCLSLGGNKLGWEFLKELGASKFNGLMDLSLDNNPLFENGKDQIDFENCSFEELRSLNLSHTGLTQEVITKLGKIALPQLGKLAISQNKLGVAEIQSLNSSGLFSKIYSLDISENSFKDQFIQALIESQLPRLTCLFLNKNILDEMGHLVGDQSPKLSDHHFEALAKAKYFPNLSILEIDFNSVSFFTLEKVLTTFSAIKLDYISSKYNSNIRGPQLKELVDKIKAKHSKFEIYIEEFEEIMEEDFQKYFDNEELIDQKEDIAKPIMSDASRILMEDGGTTVEYAKQVKLTPQKELAKMQQSSPGKEFESPKKMPPPPSIPDKVEEPNQQGQQTPKKPSESPEKKEETSSDIWEQWKLSDKGKAYLREQCFDVETLQLMSKQQIEKELPIPKADKVKIFKKLGK